MGTLIGTIVAHYLLLPPRGVAGTRSVDHKNPGSFPTSHTSKNEEEKRPA